MPAEWEQRARPGETADLTQLSVLRFDLFSTAIRPIARGDEPDYFVVIAFLEPEAFCCQPRGYGVTDRLPSMPPSKWPGTLHTT